MSAGKINCCLIGEGTLLIRCAELISNGGHKICGIISSEPAIKRWAREKNISHIPPSPSPLRFLAEHSFDYLFSIANLSLISKDLLTLPRRGTINFHDALLPRYAGLYATSR
jgi:methionyl-tRNA formyltransferase